METLWTNAFAGHTRMGFCVLWQGAGIGILPECRFIYDYGKTITVPAEWGWGNYLDSLGGE